MEFNNILQNWKTYQKWQLQKRLQMANMFPCSLHSDTHTFLNIPLGTLSFINEGEHRLEVRCGQLYYIIPIRNLIEYRSEGRNVLITQRRGEPLITLQFPTPDIRAVAFTHLENFTREWENCPKIPNLPSSESPSPPLQEYIDM